LHYKLSMLACAYSPPSSSPPLSSSFSMNNHFSLRIHTQRIHTPFSLTDMFSYYGIAGSITVGIINYVILGFQFPVDGYFMHAFEIWLATTVVFWGSGTIGYTLLEYRLGRKSLVSCLVWHLRFVSSSLCLSIMRPFNDANDELTNASSLPF
jgi:hypothetical protein